MTVGFWDDDMTPDHEYWPEPEDRDLSQDQDWPECSCDSTCPRNCDGSCGCLACGFNTEYDE